MQVHESCGGEQLSPWARAGAVPLQTGWVPLGCGSYGLNSFRAVADGVVASHLGVLSHDVCPCQEAKGFSGPG